MMTVMHVAKNKKNKKKEQSVQDNYVFGMVFLLYSILFGYSGFGSIIVALIITSIITSFIKKLRKKQQSEDETYVTVEDPKPKTEPKKTEEPVSRPAETVVSTGDPELDEVVRQGRAAVVRLQELNDDIPDFKVSAQLKQIEILTDSIIDQVEQKKEKLKQTRQFMNYYLPTTIKLLEQYVQLQNVGLKGENIESGMRQIEEMLDKVIVAFQKQLDSLFERDVIDITADIQVMEQMMAGQGLTESDF